MFKKKVKLIGWTELNPFYAGKEAELDKTHIRLLKKEIIKNGYIICGDTHQYKAVPLFNDGPLLLSMRRWAEIMSEALNENLGIKTTYRQFYCAAGTDFKEILPTLTYYDTLKRIE